MSIVKNVLGDIDLYSNYRIRTLMLWKIDNRSGEYWTNVRPLDFVREFIGEVLVAVETEFIGHYFIRDCNIFFQKSGSEKMKRYREVSIYWMKNGK